MQIHPSGTRIAGRYEVAGRPLIGGMGIVYLCFDHQEQRPVALKTFKPKFLPDRAARERFLEEGNTWVRLGKHPHIVRCYQVFQDSPRPEVYLVLELVAKDRREFRDASLRSWLTPEQPLPTDQALLIALQIVRGMRHATETIPGFVHRDLKPENVLVGADRLSNAPINRVRVTDFGLVRGLRAEQVPAATATDLAQVLSRLTRIGSIVGTPYYMAPEQWESSDVTPAADIYAVGCILGEMLSGRLLVQGQTLDALRQAHQSGKGLAATCSAPAALHDLLSGCLAIDPARRYANWDTIEAALAEAYRTATDLPLPGLEAASALSRTERIAAGWSYSAMGVSCRQMGNAPAALDYLHRAHQIGQAEGEPRLRAAVLSNLGLAYADLGDARQAIDFHQLALAITQEAGDRHGEGTVLGNLGGAYRQLGDLRRSIGYSEQALAIAWEIDDRHGEVQNLTGLGTLYVLLGDTRRAIGYYEQALAIAQEIGDRRGEGAVLSGLGGAYSQMEDARRAIYYLKQAPIISRELGDRLGEGQDLGNLGIAYRQFGDIQRAVGCYEQALAIAQELGDRRGEGAALGHLGSAYGQLGDSRRAIGFFEQALMIAQERGDRREEGTALGNLGTAYRQLGDLRRASDYYDQALAIDREIGDLSGVATDSYNMAVLHRQRGDTTQALTVAREAVRIWNQLGPSDHAQRAQKLIAQLERQGH